MTTQTRNQYSIERPDNDQLILRISEIFSRNGNPKALDHLRWQYIESPGGGSHTSFAVSAEGADAAVYSVFKVEAKINGQKGIICQSLDTLTDKDHRGQGLFTKLADDVYRACELDNIFLVYGFPNTSSGPGFFSKLQWQNLGDPPFRIYLNNLLYPINYYFKTRFFLPNIVCTWFIRRIIKSRRKNTAFQIENLERFDGEYDLLWARFASTLDTTVWRDSKYMNWRYRDKPGVNYSIFAARVDGELFAVVVFSVLEKHEGKIGYIMDLIYDARFAHRTPAMLASALVEMNNQKVDAILAWDSFSDQESPYRKVCFSTLPRKFQPIKLFFGYRQIKSSVSCLPGKFFISYADSDTV